MIQGAKTILKLDWNKAFEFTWRILVFIVAIGIIIVVSTNWSRWEGGAGWQTTNDAYLQADLTPISAKVGGYLRELPIQDYERVHKDQVLAQLVDDDYRAAVAQAQASIDPRPRKPQALKAQHELQLANIQAARAVVASTTRRRWNRTTATSRGSERLLETGSSSTEAREKLETTRAQLTAQLAQNRAQASAAERQLAVLAAQIAAERGGARRGPSGTRCGQAQSELHHHHGDSGRGHRAAPGEAGATGGRGHPDHDAHALAECLGHRQLQGDAAHPHGRRAKGRDHRRLPFPATRCADMCWHSRRHRVPNSRCCRPTMRPATSPRSCSASR